MTSFFIIALCLSAGLAFQKVKQFPANTAEVLNLYVIWVALPALILANAPHLPLNRNALIPMGVAWSALILSVIIVLLLAKFFRWSRATTCVLLLLVPLGNTSFVGIPLINALLGKDAVRYAILYDQLGSFLALASYGSLVLAIFGGKQFQPALIVKKVLFFPPFIALALALLLNVFNVSPEYLLALGPIGATLVPVVMVAVGYQWRFRLPKHDRLPLILGLSIKLLVAPFLVWFGLTFISLPDEMFRTLVLESAMAPMISAGALAISEGHRPQLAAAMVGYGMLVAFATVPLIYWIVSSS